MSDHHKSTLSEAKHVVMDLVLEFCEFKECVTLALAHGDCMLSIKCEQICIEFAEKLKRAAQGGTIDEVKLLLKLGVPAGFPVDSLCEGFTTPLLIASGRGRHEIVKVLLNAGADPNWRDENGSTALDFAIVCSRNSFNGDDRHPGEDSDFGETARVLRSVGAIRNYDYGDY